MKALVAALLALLIPVVASAQRTGPGRGRSNPRRVVQAQAITAQLPLTFEENRGQADRRVRYIGRAPGTQVFVTDRDMVITLFEPCSREELEKWGVRRYPIKGSAVRVRLAGAGAASSVRAVTPLSGRVNYLIGNDPKKWITDVRQYASVFCDSVMPGIGVSYDGGAGFFEYNVHVDPGTDASQLAVNIEGARSLALDPGGDLIIKTDTGNIIHKKPFAYQMEGGRRKQISCSYTAPSAGRTKFQVGTYDRRKPLIIDPVVVYENAIDNTGHDLVRSVAGDAAGNAYITGQTSSADFPVTASVLKTSLSVNEGAAFVAKINPTGTGYVYSTYLGGGANSSADGYAIAVDSSGNAYVAGRNTAGSFPLVNPIQSTGALFVCKLNPTGTALVYSSKFGSTATQPYGIALDSSNRVRVVGQTDSSGGFPLVNAFQSSVAAGNFAGFVIALNPAGSAVQFSSYMGGSTARIFAGDSVVGVFPLDAATTVACDSAGNTYIAGNTNSASFPLLNPLRNTVQGTCETFVMKLNAAGSLAYSTLHGGNSTDIATSIAINSGGNATVSGLTRSMDLPLVTPYNGNTSPAAAAFLSTFNAAGSAITYSTFFRGGGSLVPPFMAVDAFDRIYFDSVGSITAVNPPVGSGVSAGATIVGWWVAVLDPLSNTIVMTAPLKNQTVTSLALDPTGALYVSQISQPPPGQFASLVTKISSLSAPPVLAITNVQPTLAKRDVQVTVTATTDQALATASLTIGGKEATLASQAGFTYTFTRTLDGTEGQPAPPIVFSGQTSGGGSSTVTSNALTTDFTIPSFSAISASPTSARIGTAVTLIFTASETLAGNPTVTVGNQTANFSSKSGLNYTYTLTVQSSAGEGLPVVTISGTDAAGNPGSSTAQPLTTDFTPPSFSNINANPTLAKIGTAVSVTFTASEALSANPTVTIGSQTLNFVSKSGLNYTYSASISMAAGEGSPAVTVSGSDAVGNPGSTTAHPLTTDFTDPNFSSITATPGFAKIGTSVSITFAASETLGSNPTVSIGTQTANFVSKSGLNYTYSLNIGMGAGEGTPSISVSGSDVIGNTGSSSAQPLVTDFTAPGFTSIAATPNLAKIETLVTITFAASEALSANPTVIIGSQSADFASKSGLNYTYTVTISAAAGQGTPSVVVSGTDVVGNPGSTAAQPLATDFTPPSFDNIAASPNTAKIDTLVSLTFTASEAVASNPSVTVGAQTATFVSKSGLNYTYSVTVSSAAGEGSPLVSVSGTDVAGNPGTSTANPLFTDFTAPSFANITASPALARNTTAVTIAFTASEPLTANPSVTVGSQSANFASKSGLNYTYSITIGAAAGEGSPLVTVSGTDTVGNPGSSTANPLTTDFTSPSFAGIAASPSLAKIGTLVSITFAASEAVTGNPSVSVGAQTAGFVSKSGLNYTYSVTVSAAAGEGSPNVSVSATDLAGNPGTSTANPLTTDFTGPSFASFSAIPPLAKATTPVTISFTASEALAANPTVTIGGQGAAFATKQGLVYSYTRTIDGTEGQSQPPVLVQATDVAGNPGESTGTPLTTDFTDPTVSNLLAAPTLAISGTAVSITFDVSEALAANPAVTVGGQAADFVSLTGQHYAYRREIDRSEGEGQPAVEISGADPAGNPLQLTTNAFTTDFTPPSFANIAASPSLARMGTVVALTFTASEALGENPSVHVGGDEAFFTSKSGLDFTYSVTISSAAGEGSPLIAVSGRDVGGNVGSSSAQPLVTDFTPPGFSNLSVSPSIARVGTTVTVSFTTSEALGQTPQVSVGGRSAAPANKTGNTYEFKLPLNGTEAEGTATVVISAVDAAGNPATDQSLSLVTDFTKPNVANLSASPSFLKDGSTLTISFSASESITTTPTVAVGAVNVPLASRSGPTYTYEHLVAEAEGAGQKPITVHLADNAGNTNDLNPASVTYDFTKPTFSNVVATPAAASRGTTVAIDFAASESLDGNPSVNIGGKSASFVSASGNNYRFSRPIDGTEGEGNPEVLIAGADPAGNPGTGSFTPLRTDFTKPGLSNLSVAPSPASTGTTVTISFLASEVLGVQPTVSIGGKGAELSTQNNQNYSFARRIDGTETEGSAEVNIGLVDLVGNTNTVTTTTVLDFHAPVATFASIQPSFAKVGTTVTIVIDVNQELAAAPTLTIGGRAVAPGSQNGLRYTFAETISTSHGEGRPVIAFTARNLAGNTSVTNSTGLVTDFTAPTATVSAQPAAIRAQVKLTVTVETSEDLAAAPSVTLGSLNVDLATQQGRLYVFEKMLDGSEPQGSTTIHVRGRDPAGNELIDDSKSVVVDFTPPQAQNVTSAPDYAKDGTQVQITFSASEQLTTTPEVKIGDASAGLSSRDQNNYIFSYTARPADGDGAKVISIALVDPAGNTAEDTTRSVTLDFTPPATSNLSVAPTIVRTGSEITAQFSVSENLATTPSVTLGNSTFLLLNQNDLDFRFSHTVTTNDTEGVQDFKIQLSDQAGNTAVTTRPITVDFTPPRLAPVSVTPSHATSGTEVMVSFAPSEALTGTPSVIIGDRTASFLTLESGRYRFSRVIDRNDQEGPLAVRVTGQDLAGNEGVDTSASVVADFSAPAPSNVAVSPLAGKRGTDILISFGVTNPVTGTPFVSIANQPFALLGLDSGVYSFRRTLNGDEGEGLHVPEIRLVDAAGNSSVTTASAVRTDFTTPAVGAFSVSPLAGTTGTTVTIELVASEPLGRAPTVQLGGRSSTLLTSAPPFYQFTHTISGQEPAGLSEVRMTLEDLVGNVGTSIKTTFEVDYTPPRFTRVFVSPGPFSIGSTVIVSVTASESLRTTPTLGFEMYESLGQDGDSYIFAHFVNGTEVEGDVPIHIIGEDNAGNTGRDSTATFRTDFTLPEALDIHAGPSPATIGNTVAIDFHVSEPLIIAPTVLVGGQEASLVSSNGLNYAYEHEILGDENQGNLPVEIQLTDPAGNYNPNTSKKIVIDFTAPRPIIAHFPAPSAKEGQVVQLRGIGSSDVSGITSYAWSIGRQPVSTSPNIDHVFRDGTTTATIELAVTDGVGLRASATLLLPILNVSPTVTQVAVSTPASGFTTISWRTVEPGSIDNPLVTIEAQDLITEMRTTVVENAADVQRFSWDTRSSKESMYQLFVTVRDKDGGEGTGSSSPVIVNNKSLVIATGGAQPRFFNPAFSEGTALTYTLSEHAYATVKLIRPSDLSVIATIQTSAFQHEGSRAALWDGKHPATGGVIQDGQYGYVVEGTDLLGNHVTKNSLEAGYVVVLDTTPPAPPTIDSFAGLTKEKEPTLSGTKEPGSGIRILNQLGTEIVDATPDDSGTWSTGVKLVEGVNQLAVLAKDSAGNTSTAVPAQITLDSIAPPAPVILTSIPSPTLLDTLTITGTKEAGTALISNGVTRTASTETEWTETFNLKAGDNAFLFRAIDAAGNISDPASAATFRTPNVVAAPTVESPLFAKTTAVNVTGTKEANTRVAIRNLDTGETITVLSDALPTWSASLPLPVEEGNAFAAESVDGIGSHSPESQFIIVRDTQPPSMALAEGLTGSVTTSANLTIGISYDDPRKPGQVPPRPALSGINVASAKLLLDGIDVTNQCTVTATSATLPSQNVSPGAHSVVGIVEDNAGNVATVSSTFFLLAPDDGTPPVLTVRELLGAEFSPAFNPYNVEHEEKAGVSFTTNVPVTGTLTVRTPAGTTVQVVAIPQLLPPTPGLANWNGKDTQGVLVQNGIYTMQLQVTNFFGKSSTASPVTVRVNY